MYSASTGTISKVWICGQARLKADYTVRTWEIVGVFSSQEKAIQACRDMDYFVGPMIMNQAMPHEPTEWEGSFYPFFPLREA